MKDKAFDFLHITQAQFDRIADFLELDQPTRDFLRTPQREHHFSIPVHMDDDSVKIFRGYRIQHNDARGPCRGGIRFHPQETVDSIRALAMLMTWKSAVMDLPLGGSMGGVICDLHDLSSHEQERLCRGWVRQAFQCIGADRDVLGLDLMSTPQHMLWMLDEYETLISRKNPAFITGKPVTMGGSRGGQEATGYGVMITVREALKDLGIQPSDTSASIQGFGNVARSAIDLYQRLGGQVKCVSCWDHFDRTAHTYCKKDGINLEELLSITNHFGEIDEKQAIKFGYECLPGEAWLEQEVDILVPAALENQITSANMNRISNRVKIIAEGANSPTTPEADEFFHQKDILVIPDLLANAGGFISNYFEQVQGSMNYYWSQDEILGKLDRIMTSAYLDITNLANQNHVTLRDAAYLISVERVAQACHERGWV